MGGMGMGAVTWQEILPGKDGSLINDVVKKQYDLAYGSWPTAYNEVVLVLDEKNELDDMALYALGLKSEQEIRDLMLVDLAAAGQMRKGRHHAITVVGDQGCGIGYHTPRIHRAVKLNTVHTYRAFRE
jgi:hypothetical protein